MGVEGVRVRYSSTVVSESKEFLFTILGSRHKRLCRGGTTCGSRSSCGTFDRTTDRTYPHMYTCQATHEESPPRCPKVCFATQMFPSKTEVPRTSNHRFLSVISLFVSLLSCQDLDLFVTRPFLTWKILYYYFLQRVLSLVRKGSFHRPLLEETSHGSVIDPFLPRPVFHKDIRDSSPLSYTFLERHPPWLPELHWFCVWCPRTLRDRPCTRPRITEDTVEFLLPTQDSRSPVTTVRDYSPNPDGSFSSDSFRNPRNTLTPNCTETKSPSPTVLLVQEERLKVVEIYLTFRPWS